MLQNKSEFQTEMTDSKMAGGTKCKFFNSGFCKFTNKCKFIHPKSNCQNESCKSKGCQLRHPKPCRYNDKCRRQTTCLYKHNSDEKNVICQLNKEIEELKKANLKLRNETKITELDIEKLNKEIEKLKKTNIELHDKIKMFERAPKLKEVDKKSTKEKTKELHSCSDCFRQFATKSLLNKHLKSCEVKKLFICKTCKAEFKQDNDIFYHKDNCEHYCENCQVCVGGKENHILEEIENS